MTKVAGNYLWTIAAICTTALISDVAIASEVTATTNATQISRPQGDGDFVSGQWSVASGQEMYMRHASFAESRATDNELTDN